MITTLYPPPSPLHHQWRRDRAVRQRVPLFQAHRNLLGIASAITPAPAPGSTPSAQLNELVLHHGDLRLIPNDRLTWLALRDIPPGHFPAARAMHSREVTMLSTTQAALRYGLPSLDFSSPSRFHRDFRFFPLPMNRDRLLPHGPRYDGDILDSDEDPEVFAIANAVSWKMTTAAFGAVDRDGQPLRRAWFKRRPRFIKPSHLPRPVEWMPTSYVAVDVESVPKLLHVPWNRDIFRAYLRDLYKGLPLRVPARAVYAGTTQARLGRRTAPAHAWKLEDGEWLGYFLPAGAEVHCRLGDTLEPGAVWCTALPEAKGNSNFRGERNEQLRQLWLSNQGNRFPGYAGYVFFPAWLAARAIMTSDTRALVWDFAPCLRYFDDEASAFIPPPIFLRGWDQLRLSLPGEVDLCAQIRDPRFEAVGSPPVQPVGGHIPMRYGTRSVRKRDDHGASHVAA